MRLTPFEEEMLEGKHGKAVAMALSTLLQLGEYFDAEEFVEISMVHDDGVVYVGEAPAEFAETLLELGAKVCVPTSLNACDVDLRRWRDLRVPEEKMKKYNRLTNAHLKLGTTPTWTCAPYQGGMIPRFGEQIAWAESNATVFANSVLGARTNRYAGLVDLCAAITGRVPRYGLHIKENRRAEILFRLVGFKDEMLIESSLYPLLGYFLGREMNDKIVALEGIPKNITVDSLKGFGAAAASSGAVSLFHMIGVTPEASSQEMCFQGKKPDQTIDISPSVIAQIEDNFNQVEEGGVDLIIAGCPHYSYQEFFRLLKLLRGRKIHQSLQCWIFTSRAILQWLNDSGYSQALKASGIEIFTDGCCLAFPRKEWGINSIVTDSMKMANYTHAQTGCKVVYRPLADCVETAVIGKLVKRKMPWN